MIQKFQKTKLAQSKITKDVISKKLREATSSKKKREIQQCGELQQYLRKIDETPSMSFKKEKNFWREIEAKEGDKRLEDKILVANLRLVVSIARKYRDNDYLTFLELIKAGENGLKRAIEVFKWHWKGRGKFSSYAKWWIRQAIAEAVVNGSLPGDLQAVKGLRRRRR